MLGLLAGAVAATAFASFVGGPYQRLPPEQRSQYEQRLVTAIGPRLDGLSEAQKQQRIEAWLSSGLLRLDDPRLGRRFELEVAALTAVDEPTCASFARQSLGGTVTNDISSRIIDALDTAKLGDWIGINVEAIEAEMRTAPDKHLVSDAEVNGAYDRLIATLSESTSNTIVALANGQPAADTEACAAARAFYSAVLGLDDSSRAIVARYDVQTLE